MRLYVGRIGEDDSTTAAAYAIAAAYEPYA